MSTMNALAKLFEAAAPALGAQPDQLEAIDGNIRVKGNPNKSLTWAAACRKLGTNKISEMGVVQRTQWRQSADPGRLRACRSRTSRWTPKPAS